MAARAQTNDEKPVVNLDDLLAADDKSNHEETPSQADKVAAENKALLEKLAEQEKLIEALKQKSEQDSAASVPTHETATHEISADGSQEDILIHFLQDGFTFGGRVFYRGQEVLFEYGSVEHRQQLDRQGKSWLDLADNPAAQVKRWGQHYFSRGPWPYLDWDDDTIATTDEERQNIKRAAEAEKARGRKAPRISGM